MVDKARTSEGCRGSRQLSDAKEQSEESVTSGGTSVDKYTWTSKDSQVLQY